MFKDINDFKLTYSQGTTFVRRSWWRKREICGSNIKVFLPTGTVVTENFDEVIQVKYKIEFLSDGRSVSYYSPKDKKKIYSQTTKKITHLELPEFFDKLDKDDFSVDMSVFIRGGELIPCIGYIEIINYSKYKMLKIQIERKNKILKLDGN